jgi:hypothetical protein
MKVLAAGIAIAFLVTIGTVGILFWPPGQDIPIAFTIITSLLAIPVGLISSALWAR